MATEFGMVKFEWNNPSAAKKVAYSFLLLVRVIARIFVCVVLCCLSLNVAVAKTSEVLEAEFKKTLAIEEYEKFQSSLDNIVQKSERLGIDFGPALYVKALRNVTHAEGRDYQSVLRSIDLEIQAAAFLLPKLVDFPSISETTRKHYLTVGFNLLSQRTTAGNWITPLMMQGLIKERFGQQRMSTSLFNWYAKQALEDASPVANTIALASASGNQLELQDYCERIALTGSVNNHAKCSKFSFNPATSIEKYRNKILAYKSQIERKFGANFASTKAVVCGQLAIKFSDSLLCYDALASVDELCFARTENNVYGQVELLFVCDVEDIRWINSIMADFLKSEFKWKVER